MKRINLTPKDTAFIAASTALVVAVSTIGWSLIGVPAIGIGLGLASASVLFSTLEAFRRTRETSLWLREQVRNDSKQIEALLSLYFVLKPDSPLPNTGDWALSPDLLKRTLDVIYRDRPRLVVEASSGVSTLIAAHSLKRLGGGRVISLEHDASYAAISRDMIAAHGLGDVATIVHAPLREITLPAGKWLWYDLDRVQLDEPIDLLLIDGPPAATQLMARYPALPLLYGNLRDDATVILDDGNRPDEKRIVERWSSEFAIECDYVPLEKGAFFIRKRVGSTPG